MDGTGDQQNPGCSPSNCWPLFAQEIILVSSQVYWFRRRIRSSSWSNTCSAAYSKVRAMKIARTSHLPSPSRQTKIDSPCSSSRRVCSSKSRGPARPQSGEKAKIPHGRTFRHPEASTTETSAAAGRHRVVIAPPLPTVLGHGISRCHPTRGD